MEHTRHKVNIIGHQNPDTDSICSAIAYAWLKNKLGGATFEARRAGNLNRETAFVLKYFGVRAPRLCTDVSPQIKDIDIRRQPGIAPETSLHEAWEQMRDTEIDTLCMVDEHNELLGLITVKDIANANMDLFDTGVLASARTSYRNVAENAGRRDDLRRPGRAHHDRAHLHRFKPRGDGKQHRRGGPCARFQPVRNADVRG